MQAGAPAFGFRSASDRLGWWNLYFIAKLVLFALGLVGLHVIENVAFAVALAAMAGPRLRRYRPWIGVPVAIALLYYDSWLPGISRAISQASLIWSFSGAYLAELAGRFVSFTALAAIAVAAAAYWAAARFIRLDIFVMVAIVGLGLALAPSQRAVDAAMARGGDARGGDAKGGDAKGGDAKGGDARGNPDAKGAETAKNPELILADFLRTESPRAVSFARPPEATAPFDVIFLHVCSLSWDDLEATGLQGHPLLQRFDIVLKRFNTVSTYSGPAVIRFLRGSCGQPSHRGLYEPARPECLLMPALEGAGLEAQLALNHDGHFDDFLQIVKAHGLAKAPLSNSGLPALMRAFDDSRIHDDAALLARWLEARQKAPAARAALYYNTVSLHDGNRLASNPKVKSSETYKARLQKLLDDLDGFVTKLEASGRRAVVALVPEHGAAWRGDAAQISGLREIPTPAITLVPVAVKVIGPDAKREGEAVQVPEPTSFLAVSHIVSRMLAKPPYGAAAFRARDYVEGLPTTAFVSEGETAVVVRRGDAYMMREGREAWRELK